MSYKITDKKEIRKFIKNKRSLMDEREVSSLSALISERLLALPELLAAENVCAYISKGNEVDTGCIISCLWSLGKRVYVPKVYGKDMHFHRISSFDELVCGSYGIMEPEGDIYDDVRSGVIIIPGVAFDKNLSRIGFGGGYYDRYLAVHDGLFKVALAYDFQVVDEIQAEPTDIRPDVIVTQSRIYP